MTKSARIQACTVELLADECPHTVQEIKSYLERVGLSDYTEGQFSGSINTLLRNGTIQKVDRAIYILKKTDGGVYMNNTKCCFVVSPIGEEGSTTRSNADKVYRHIILPVCESCGFTPERVDHLNNSDSITQTIIEKLQTADLVIADLSEHNPNVFYEMGYRKCTNKPIIHLKRKNETIPFDVNTIRTFEYDLTDLDSVESVKSRLMQTIGTFTFEENLSDVNSETIPEAQNLSGILSMLYQLQDSIDDVRALVERKDKEMIQTIVQTSLNNAPKEESTDAIMMKVLLPELIKNPQGFANLMKLAEMTEK